MTQNTHSRLAPSASKQWVHCTASISFTEQLVSEGKIKADRGSSFFADEGTEAHEWGGNCLASGDTIIASKPVKENPDFDYDEMQVHVTDYVDFCKRITEPGDVVFVEEKVPLFYMPEEKGTVDYAAVSDDRVYIADLKYGQGIIVEAKENTQLASYAMSLVENLDMVFDFTEDTLVTMAVFQPRIHDGNPVKLWVVSLKELREFAAQITEAATNIRNMSSLKFDPETEGVCQWCPCKLHCDARKAHHENRFSEEGIEALGIFTDLDTEITSPEFKTLTQEQIARIVQDGPAVIKWIKSIQEAAKDHLLEGMPIEGLKVVKGKPGNRTWSSVEEADKLLRGKLKADTRYKKTLVTLPQAEKLLKGMDLSTRFQNRFKELTQRKPGNPILVTADDPREDISIKAEDAFDMLD